MLWLALLPYALTRQPVWVQDGDDILDAWHGRILAVLPGVLLFEADNTKAGDHEGASPYLVLLPLDRIRAVRERFPGEDVKRFETLLKGPDGNRPPQKGTTP